MIPTLSEYLHGDGQLCICDIRPRRDRVRRFHVNRIGRTKRRMDQNGLEHLFRQAREGSHGRASTNGFANERMGHLRLLTRPTGARAPNRGQGRKCTIISPTKHMCTVRARTFPQRSGQHVLQRFFTNNKQPSAPDQQKHQDDIISLLNFWTQRPVPTEGWSKTDWNIFVVALEIEVREGKAPKAFF